MPKDLDKALSKVLGKKSKKKKEDSESSPMKDLAKVLSVKDEDFDLFKEAFVEAVNKD